MTGSLGTTHSSESWQDMQPKDTGQGKPWGGRQSPRLQMSRSPSEQQLAETRLRSPYRLPGLELASPAALYVCRQVHEAEAPQLTVLGLGLNLAIWTPALT